MQNNGNVSSHISVHDANLRVPNKKGLHTALQRNGFMPPRLGDTISTVKFLKNVRTKRYWCPHASESITLKPCADVPSRKELAAICYSVMSRYRSVGEPQDSGLRRTAKWIRRRPPGVDWMLLVLSTIDGDNAIFHRDYVHQRLGRSAEVEQASHVDNLDNFFDGLPIVQGASGRRGVSFLSKQQLKDARLVTLTRKMQRLQSRIGDMGSDSDGTDSDEEPESEERSDAVNPLSSRLEASRNVAMELHDVTQVMQQPVNIVVEDNASVSSHHTNVIGNSEDMDVQQIDRRSDAGRAAFGELTMATQNRV